MLCVRSPCCPQVHEKVLVSQLGAPHLQTHTQQISHRLQSHRAPQGTQQGWQLTTGWVVLINLKISSCKIANWQFITVKSD